MTEPVDAAEIRATLLRSALDHVIATSRTNRGSVPAGLQKVLRFKKLSESARQQVARSVESDGDFRVAMSDGVTDATVGQAGVLWLQRPEGWEARLDALIAQQVRREAALDALRASDDSEREETQAQEALGGANAQIAQLTQQVADLVSQGEHDRAELRAQARTQVELEAALETARSERVEAIRQLKHQEVLLARSVEERRTLQANIAASDTVTPQDLSDAAAARQQAADARRVLVAEATTELAALQETLVSAAARTAALSARMESRMAADSESTASGPVGDAPATPGPTGKRTPISLPGGVWDDADDAAVHLLATPGVTVLMDGYNVTISRWPTLTISDQRDRLAQVAGGLAARTGAQFTLVWDGADGVGGQAAPALPRGVTAQFTSSAQEADDWIIEWCSDAPADRPLIVVSDDRRVRDGVAAFGVNLLTGGQLLSYAHE